MRMEKPNRRIHVRQCTSAAGHYKPQTPFSSCLKECSTVILCTCLWRVCAWAGVCNGDQMGSVCHMTVMFSYWLEAGLLGGPLWWFVRSVETKRDAVGAAACVRILCLAVVCSVCTLKLFHGFIASHSCVDTQNFTVAVVSVVTFYKCSALSCQIVA